MEQWVAGADGRKLTIMFRLNEGDVENPDTFTCFQFADIAGSRINLPSHIEALRVRGFRKLARPLIWRRLPPQC